MMSGSKSLTSGEQLVEQGATKHDTSLPSVGPKEVLPSGSWLERKQVQAALESRRHLLEVQRIEKSGAVSHAHWDACRELAVVTQQAGPHWQYYGHHEGGQLFLWPEEALFLIETNCLKLSFNEVTVSLQQAYTLLLRGRIDIIQYQVYASLSRVGYRVFRHQFVEPEGNAAPSGNGPDTNEGNGACDENKNDTKMDLVPEGMRVGVSNIEVDNSDAKQLADAGAMEVEVGVRVPSRKELKLQKLRERKYLYRTKMDDYFSNIPDMCRKVTVKVGVPEQNLFPRNVFPNQVEYKIDLDRVKLKSVASSPPPARPPPATSSSGAPALMRIEQAPARAPARGPAPHSMAWSPRFAPCFQSPPQGFWNFGRPRLAMMYNMLLQRPLLMQHFAAHAPPSPHFYNFRPPFMQREGARGRRPPPPHSQQHVQELHLQRIRSLAGRLRRLAAGGGAGAGAGAGAGPQALRSLLRTYNQRYAASLSLSPAYELLEGAEPETIELDDEEPRAKRSRRAPSSDADNYEQRFAELEELAGALRALERAGRLRSRHRRAFAALLREFNAAHAAAAALDRALRVSDGSRVVLDSDSDSDCAIESPELPQSSARVASKKLLNPFSVLRQRAQTSDPKPGTSAAGAASADTTTDDADLFKSWLPKDDDFGRRELISKTEARNLILDTKKSYHIFDFLKQYSFYKDFKNWNQVKSVFWESIEERVEYPEVESSAPRAKVASGAMGALGAAGAALVVAACRGVLAAGSLQVHFDVYNRDVQNFKKSNKPKPHFRICCVSESSGFPSGAEIATLHAKYADGVPLAFALAAAGAGCCLQAAPQPLPVYRGRED